MTDTAVSSNDNEQPVIAVVNADEQLKHVLKNCHFEAWKVVHFKNEDEFFSMFEKKSINLAAVISTSSITAPSGIAFYRQLHYRRFISVPFFIVTGFVTNYLLKIALHAGVADVFETPVSTTALQVRVKFAISNWQALRQSEKSFDQPFYQIPLSKRIFDIVLASMALVVLSPVFLLIMLALKIDSRKHIFQQAEESLKRLETDYIDLYQIHGFDVLTPIEETLRALDDLVKSGKVRYIGCSNLAAWHLMKALGYSTYHGLSRFVSLQAYYTIAGRDLERELVPLLADQKVGLMVWSPLAGGLLSGKYGRNLQGPEDSRRVNFDFPPVNKEKAFDIIEVMQTIAEEKAISVAQLALAWLLHQPVVSSVIIGAKKIEQLDDNLKAIDVVLSPEDLEKLDEVSKLSPEYPGWMLERQGRDRQA